MKSLFGGVGLFLIVAIAVTLYSSLYVVRETERALVLQFGEVVGAEDTPGLKFKLPFIQNVLYFDNRVLDLDSPVQEIIAADQERLVVDTFARFRITDSLAFFQTVGNLNGAQSRLSTVLNSATRRVLGEVSYITIVRDDRGALMASIRDQVNRESRSFGMEIVDVRIRRADLPEANSQAIFQRMQTEREREATEIRAQGEEAAQRIRSRADREVTVLVADATREGEQIRGEGDGERTRIFAEAFGQDQEFFSFYRSMQAYEAGFSGGASLVISPDSDFFRYFGDQQGGTSASTTQGSPLEPSRIAPAVQAQ